MRGGDTTHTTYSPELQSTRLGRLRTRAVLREADLSDFSYRKALAAKQLDRRLELTPDQREQHPLVRDWTDTHDGYPPPVTRHFNARLRHLKAMHATHGPLVLLRLSLPALDAYPLYSRDMSNASRAAVLEVMRDLSGKHHSYTADVQRGAAGHAQTGTHVHAGTPLALLPDDYRDRLWNAPHGLGGGIELPRHAAHGVVILPTEDDLEAVARYVTRHPDARLDNRDGPTYLQALEDELARLARKDPVVKLGWTRNIPRHLSTEASNFHA